MGPKLKLWGNLSLDGISKAVKEMPSKVKDYKGEKQLSVKASQWDDGGISLDIWDNEKKVAIKIGSLRIETPYGESQPAQSSAADNDLPF